MTRIGRYNLSEISTTRLFYSISLRKREIYHDFSWHFLPFAGVNRERIKNYKNIHEGERCFIVANGPSLQKTNLDLLKNEYTFGLNRIYLIFTNSTFRPTYYVASNELVLDQFSHEISLLEMPKFINWNKRSLFDTNDSKIIFLKSKMVLSDSFQKDITHPLVVGGTVTFVAMQIAFYMGFRKIILVGLDHKYAERGTPNVHEVRKVQTDESHFHPDYFPKGFRWQLPDLLRSEIDFEIARKVFENNNSEIIDATVDGNCHVFKKIDYLSLF